MEQAFDLSSPKKLGFGLMRLPGINRNAGDVDLEATKKLVDAFLAKGFTYFDTAYTYGGGASEEAARKCIVERYPRDSFTIATKFPSPLVHSKDQVEGLFRTSLERLGVDYIDYYLVHGIMNEKQYENVSACGVFEFFRKLKAEGLVRHIGFSTHATPDLIDRILNEHPEMEFVQIQLNYVDWESDGVRARECYEAIRAHGLPVIVMEPIKGGGLAGQNREILELLQENGISSPAAAALRFAAGMEGVAVVLSGMNEMEQVEENTVTLDDPVPLTEKEMDLLRQATEMYERIGRVPCTGCRYCTEGCPMSINIPSVISCLNEVRVYGMNDGAERRYAMANKVKAAECVGCGQCENACPQHLPIPELMKEAAERFD